MSTLGALRRLFRYELRSDRPVGHGGCGSVWPAYDGLFGRDVAIKTIDEALVLKQRIKAKRSFFREAIAGARLSERSRHIVKVFDYGFAGDTPYFVMEWIASDRGAPIDLGDAIGKLSLARAKAVLFEVADALQVAHANGIVHSDIAPWNIVYDNAQRLYKVADFGLLKIVEERLVSQGSASLLQGGRMDFLPPEALDDIRNVTYAADLYALAVTFRVLLEGDSCLRQRNGRPRPTPGVIRIRHEQRDAPDQVRQFLTRFIDDHTTTDTVADFVSALQRIPN